MLVAPCYVMAQHWREIERSNLLLSYRRGEMKARKFKDMRMQALGLSDGGVFI